MKQIITIFLLIISINSYSQSGTKSVVSVTSTGVTTPDTTNNTFLTWTQANLRYVKFTDTSSMLAAYQTAINGRVKYTDTASMLAAYQTALNVRVKYSDTSSMLSGYQTAINARVKYTDTSSMLSGYQTAINSKLPKSDSALVLKTSQIFPTRFSYIAYPQIQTGIGGAITEYTNYGNAAGATDSVAISKTGFIGIQGRTLMIRNMKWDSTGGNYKWLTPIQGATGYGSSALEGGSDGVNLHSSPPSVNFSDIAHVGFRVSATGTTAPSSSVSRFTSGYYNQTFRPLIGIWDSSVYVYGSNENVSWSTTLTTDPIFWANSMRGKGVENELIRAEENYTNGWPGIYNAKSRGNLVTKTAVSSGDTLGRFGFRSFDGTNYQVGAAIDARASATASAGSAPTNLYILNTSAGTTALRARASFNSDSTFRLYNTGIRQELPATMTTPADWTGVGFLNFATTSAMFQQQISGTTGGYLIYGFTNTSNTATSLLFRGWGGGTAPTVPNTIFRVGKSDGATNVTTLAATEIGWQFQNNTTVEATMLGNGNFFVGGVNAAPTAHLHAASGTTAASTAPLKLALVAPALNTTPEKFAVEVDSTTGGGNVYYTNASATRYTLAKTLTNTATLDFASTGSGAVADLTITVTGAALNDAVVLGVPNGSVTATATFTAWVSSADTVTVRFSPKATEDPASGTFRVSVLKY